MSPSYFRSAEFISLLTLAMVLIGIPVLQYQSSGTAYPAKPIRLVVADDPGSMAHLLARDIGSLLERQIGGSVIVENRAGAGIAKGALHVASASPDGYTLFMGSRRSHVVLPGLEPRTAGYDPVRDFTPLVALATETDGEWLGIFAPAGIPGDNEAKLINAMLGVLGTSGLDASLARHGLQPLSLVSSEFRDFLKRDLADWHGALRMAAMGASN